MNVAEMLSQLFNLSARTDFWNSMQAARDFWMLCAVVILAVAGVALIRSSVHHTPHTPHPR